MVAPVPGSGSRALYQYSPITPRPKLTWPGASQVALVITLYLEYWEPAGVGEGLRDPRLQGPLGAVSPDYLTLTRREYGNRVGVFRVLEVLGRHRLPVTVALGSGAASRYPRLVGTCLERGYEFAAHGGRAGELVHQNMSERQELTGIRDSVAAVTMAAGRAPTGWISQDYSESARTPWLIAREGLNWVMDWSNDDQPYWMATEPPLVSLPNHSQWHDVQLLELARLPVTRYPGLIREAFSALRQEGADSGRVFQLGVHPWVLGEAHRIRYLAEALAGIASCHGVWAATAGAVARWFTEAAAEPGQG